MKDPFNYLEKQVIGILKSSPKESKYSRFNLFVNPFLDFDQPLRARYNELFAYREDEIKEIIGKIMEAIQYGKNDIAIVGPYGSGSRTIVNFM